MNNSINVFTGNLNQVNEKAIIDLYKQHDMTCELIDNLDFSQPIQHISVKMKVENTGISAYEGKTIQSTFNIQTENFNYKEFSKNITPKQSILQKLSGVKPDIKMVSREIDQILSKSTNKLTFSWNRDKPEAFRLGAFAAAIFTELSNGVLHTSNSNSYYDKTGLIDIISHQVFLFERSLSSAEWHLEEVK